MKIKNYVCEIVLAAASSIFIYNGAKAIDSANFYAHESAKVAERCNTDECKWLQQSYEHSKNFENRRAGCLFGVSGLMLLCSGISACRTRKEEKLEEKVD